MAKNDTEVSDVVLDNRAKIDVFVQRYIDVLGQISTEHIDATRADGSAAAYEKLGNFCLKIIDGLQVDPKDGFDRLATLHVTFGDGFTSTISPAMNPNLGPQLSRPSSTAHPGDVQDVSPRAALAGRVNIPFDNPAQPPDESRPMSAEDKELFELFGSGFSGTP